MCNVCLSIFILVQHVRPYRALGLTWLGEDMKVMVNMTG